MVSFRLLQGNLKTFLAMRGAEGVLVCEAVIMLMAARLIVLTVPFRYVAPWLSRAQVASIIRKSIVSS